MKSPVIFTYSIIYSSTDDFADKIPYVSCILEQENGFRVAALLEGFVEGMDVKIGQEVKYIGKDEQGKVRYSLV